MENLNLIFWGEATWAYRQITMLPPCNALGPPILLDQVMSSTRKLKASLAAAILVGAAAAVVSLLFAINGHTQDHHLAIGKSKPSLKAVPTVPCTYPATPVVGILTIPKLAMIAPVEQGTDDSVIGVAIGHNPATVWPGMPATSELSAHDVAQFWHIDQLIRGDEIDYYSPCESVAKFSVTTAKLYTVGESVWSLPQPGLIMETCWPANNLGVTDQRLLVDATLVSVTPDRNYPIPPPITPTPIVPAPPELAALGLNLNQNVQPMGFMHTGGNPSNTWLQSPAPMNAEASALQVWFGLLDAAARSRVDWWQDLAPSVALASPFLGQYVQRHLSRMDVTVIANGSDLQEVDLSTSLGFGSGNYSIVAHMVVKSDVMTLGSIDITPV